MPPANRNGYILRPYRSDDFVDPSWKGTWKFGLFDCCSEPALCISALPCTCYYIYLDKISELTSRTDDKEIPQKNWLEMLCTCFVPAAFDLYTLCSLTAFISQNLTLVVRNRYYFGAEAGDATTTCCKFWLCKPCAMTQLLRELKYRGDDVGALACAKDETNNTSSAMRAPDPPRIYNLNPAEIELEIASYKNALAQAQQSGNDTALENAILSKITFLTDASRVVAAGGPEQVIAKQMSRLDPMVMLAAMAQPVDPERYQMYTEMKNMFRQVQETHEGRWSSDQRSRYEGMQREMSRRRAQIAAPDPSQMMMVMQLGMMQQQQQQQMQQMPLATMTPNEQQPQLVEFYSPPPPPPSEGRVGTQNSWNL